LGGERLKLLKNNYRRFPAVFLIIFLFSLNISRVFAQSEAGDQTPAQTTGPIRTAEQSIPYPTDTNAAQTSANSASSIWVVVRMLLVLVLAAAAIYGVVFFIKKAARPSIARDPYLKILASAPLGTNRSAYVISLGSKAWLVGAAENGVNLISEIDEKEILDAMLLDDSKKSSGPGGGRVLDFKTILSRFGWQLKAGMPGADNIRKRRERLKG